MSGSACRNGCSSRSSDASYVERKVFGGRLEEEVERIVDGHFGHQVHLDAELVDLFREREARDVVALRVLLPVEKVTGWRDALRIGQDRRAAVRRRTQANELRRQFDGSVVPVLRHVAKRDMDAHRTAHSYYCRESRRIVVDRIERIFSYTIPDMKIFHCDHCGHLLFFENTECVSCGHRVAYLPDLRLVGSLDPDGADNVALSAAACGRRRVPALSKLHN